MVNGLAYRSAQFMGSQPEMCGRPRWPGGHFPSLSLLRPVEFHVFRQPHPGTPRQTVVVPDDDYLAARSICTEKFGIWIKIHLGAPIGLAAYRESSLAENTVSARHRM